MRTFLGVDNPEIEVNFTLFPMFTLWQIA